MPAVGTEALPLLAQPGLQGHESSQSRTVGVLCKAVAVGGAERDIKAAKLKFYAIKKKQPTPKEGPSIPVKDTALIAGPGGKYHAQVPFNDEHVEPGTDNYYSGYWNIKANPHTHSSFEIELEITYKNEHQESQQAYVQTSIALPRAGGQKKNNPTEKIGSLRKRRSPTAGSYGIAN